MEEALRTGEEPAYDRLGDRGLSVQDETGEGAVRCSWHLAALAAAPCCGYPGNLRACEREEGLDGKPQDRSVKSVWGAKEQRDTHWASA